MNKKNNIMKFFFYILMMSILLSVLSSCAEEPDMKPASEDENYSTRVYRYGNFDYAEYGDYVYDITNDGLMRYNRVIGEYTKACTDPECNGHCLLDSPLMTLSRVVDGRLYFAVEEWVTDKYYYAYLDIVTSELHVLLMFEGNETNYSDNPQVLDGYLYYQHKFLQTDGDADNPNDYETYICRIPDRGGKEEVLYALGNRGTPIYAYGGKLYTMFDFSFYSINPLTGEYTLVCEVGAQGIGNFGKDLSFLDGKAYFLAGHNMQNSALIYSLDLESGELVPLINRAVYRFALTEQGIYYAEVRNRTLYMPADYDPKNGKSPQPIIAQTSSEIWRMDLNGENREVVYTNENLKYVSEFTVIRNVYYGTVWEYNEELHKFEHYFGSLNFNTGEIVNIKARAGDKS